MKRIGAAVGMLILILAIAAQAQSPAAKAAQQMKAWDLWTGDWTMVGTAKDTPTGPEYKLNWHFQGRWILDAFAVQLDHTWKGNGPEVRFLEVLYYDPARKIHAFHGFGSDGWTWTATVTFDKETSIENQTSIGPDGRTIACRNTWRIGTNRMTVSGRSECELDGARWTAFAVKGTRARTAARTQ